MKFNRNILPEDRIVIIGGNAAGPAAAAKAKRVNPDADVLMIEAGEYISTGTCEIPYVLNGTIKSYSDLVFFTPEEFKDEKGVDVLTNSFASAINRNEKKVVVFNKLTGNQDELSYDKLILATGSRSRHISYLPDSLSNLFNLKSVDDLKNVTDYLNNNEVENILIAGAGYIGIEAADTLSEAGYKIKLIDREDLPLQGADKEIRRLVSDRLINNNISFVKVCSEPKVRTSDNKFVSLKTGDHKLTADVVLVCAGVSPNTGLAETAKLETGISGAIRTDNKLRTSDQHIFAAGDCIEVTEFITNKKMFFPQATVAQQSGHIAGENAAGGNALFKPVLRNTIFKGFDSFVCQVGLTESEIINSNFRTETISGVANNRPHIMPDSRKVFGKIIFDKYNGQICSASFFGGQEVSGYGDIIAMMIKNRVHVSGLNDMNYNYSPPVSPFINLLSVLGRKIGK